MRRIIEKRRKRRRFAAGVWVALAMAASPLPAAPFAYNTGDLVLGLRQVDGPAPDLVVDLGPATAYDALAPGQTLTVTNLSASQLATAFPDLNGINWSVTGAQRSPGNPYYAVQTIWATAARTNVAVQSVPWKRKGQFAQGGPASVFAAVGDNASTYSSVQPAGTNNTTTGVLIPLSDPNAYTRLVQNADNSSAGDFNGAFQGNVENTTPDDFTTAQPLSRSDLYELIPASGASVGTAGKWVGYFNLTPAGVLTFTAAIAAQPPPPLPTITGVQRGGGITTVSFTTTNSVSYRLRLASASGLAAPISTWSIGGSVVSGSGTVKSLQDTNATDIRFYAVEAFYP